MRHRIPFTIALSALLLASCGGSEQENARLSLMEASRQELAAAVDERDQLLALVRDISQDMERIRELENMLALAETATNEKQSQRTRILAGIEQIRQTLRQRRERLAALEEQLKQSSFFTEELSGTIETMHRQIDRRSAEVEQLRLQLSEANERIGSLSNAVDSLNSAVTDVSNERDAARDVSARLEDELNECFYVIAPKGLLKEHKIIETGFLRKTKLMKSDFDHEFFITGDKRSLDVLHIRADKARVLTNHPDRSFRLVATDGGNELQILDADQFWSLTNYLVIQTE